jgi:hypothetical protein
MGGICSAVVNKWQRQNRSGIVAITHSLDVIGVAGVKLRLAAAGFFRTPRKNVLTVV